MTRALVALLVVGAGLLPAQQPSILTPHQVMNLRQVTQAAISPDGSLVAYLLSVPRTPEEPDGGTWSQLWIVPFDGGEPRGLMTGKRAVRNLGWTPDGRITCTFRGADKVTRVYAVPPKGGPPEALSPGGVNVRAYALSPNGKQLAYTTVPAATKQAKREKAAGFDQIVYEEGLAFVEIWICDAGGGSKRQVRIEGSAHEIGWCGDGALCYTAAPTPLVDDRYMRRDLHRVITDQSKRQLLVDVPGKFGTFVADPRGSRVAYIAGRDIKDPKESSLYVVGAGGGEPISLTAADFEGHVDEAHWLDGDTLLVRATEGCHRTVFTQPAAGGQRSILVAGGVATVQGLSLSANRQRIAMVGSTAKHPNEVFVMDLKGRPKRLTDSNAWLKDVALGEQSVIRWKARDGVEIEGLLIKPVGFESGKRYPLIVHAHGGPESCYVDGWTTRYATPGQMAAGAGYVSLYPNYRSSTGRGVAFSKAGQGDAAGAEFDDCLDGVDHLVSLGMVDKARVGITGGSYGGYFSAWAATKHSKRFAASVMFVGISNQISKVGTTDIPQESYWSHWHLRPWENVGLFLERSPITYARQCETPILILHGKDDPRVSYTQSVELYRWIKLKGGVPVRLVLYPGEGHGNRKRAHQLDYALRCMRWFDTFLKSDAKKAPPHRVDYSAPKGN